MNMRQIEIFCAIMRFRTTVAAAHELGLSQPAVSNALRHLEDSLGFALFHRIGNRLVPTVEGKAVYQDTLPLQNIANGLQRRLKDLRETRAGHLRVLSTRPLGDGLLPKVIEAFTKGREDVHIYYDVQHLGGVIEAVESGFADIGLALEVPPRPGFDVQMLAKRRMVCALSHDHALTRKSTIRPEDLIGARIIGSDAASRLGAAVSAVFHERGIPYRPSMTVLQGVTACSLVANNLGVAIVDEFSAGQWAENGIVVRPFEPAIVVSASVMSLTDRPLSRIARRFVQMTRQFADANASSNV